jgi:hypothetical protein
MASVDPTTDEHRYRFEDNQKLTFLNIFALSRSPTTPRTSTARHPWTRPAGDTALLGQARCSAEVLRNPGTQLYFTVEDASPSPFSTDSWAAAFLPGAVHDHDFRQRVVEYFAGLKRNEAHRFSQRSLSRISTSPI